MKMGSMQIYLHFLPDISDSPSLCDFLHFPEKLEVPHLDLQGFNIF